MENETQRMPRGPLSVPQDPFGSLITQSSGADGQDDESADKGPVGWRRRLARGTEGRGGQTNAQGTSKRPQDLSEALVTQSQGAEGRMNGSPGGGRLGRQGEGTNGRRNPPDAQGTSESPRIRLGGSYAFARRTRPSRRLPRWQAPGPVNDGDDTSGTCSKCTGGLWEAFWVVWRS
jgi:hypothetical protein